MAKQQQHSLDMIRLLWGEEAANAEQQRRDRNAKRRATYAAKKSAAPFNVTKLLWGKYAAR